MSIVLDYQRFKNTWNKCLLPQYDDASKTVHKQLLASYREPQRVYHALSHIEHCLKKVDEVKSLVQNPEALELSIWFHDVIYTPGAKNNEQLSADYFTQLTTNIFSKACGQMINENIMATLHNDNERLSGDTRYMVDIDLSSFGLPWDEFMQDSENVRLERPDLSFKDSLLGQLNFKRGLLKRPQFFRTKFFKQHYEAQAQKNLTHYCDLTSQKVGNL